MIWNGQETTKWMKSKETHPADEDTSGNDDGKLDGGVRDSRGAMEQAKTGADFG